MVELSVIEPPSEKSVPGEPGIGQRDASPDCRRPEVSVWVGSLWLTSVTFGAVMRTVSVVGAADIVARSLGGAGAGHVRVGAAEHPRPARCATVAPDQVPVPSTIEPRSRSWSQVRISGLTTLAWTVTLTARARRCRPRAAVTALDLRRDISFADANGLPNGLTGGTHKTVVADPSSAELGRPISNSR